MLTNADITALTDVRHPLHQHPELSGHDHETAALTPLNPTDLFQHLRDHGLAAIWTAPEPGPTLMVRAETDKLPLDEISTASHRSTFPGPGSPPTKRAMLLLGAGPGPALHNPGYEYNSALIPFGTNICHHVPTGVLG